MHNILIVGAGQLGSRHLQGALLSDFPLNIYIVDPSEDSLSVAKERALQVNSTNKETNVFYSSSLPEKSIFDVCIISTSADIRADVTKNIIAKNKIKHIIFEKVLFQKESDYNELEILLNKEGIISWVNCPRRVYEHYKKIKESLDLSLPVEISVEGSGWGMACNSVHFLDLFSFLVNDPLVMNVDKSLLDTEIIKSKRSGYYEVTGNITVTAGKHSIKIACSQKDTTELSVSIKNSDHLYFVNEIEKSLEKNVNGVNSKSTYSPVMQSQLTGSYINDLLSSGEIDLTPFSQSCKIHLPFLKCLMDHFHIYLDGNIDKCPIT